jgi:hypothetical protein
VSRPYQPCIFRLTLKGCTRRPTVPIANHLVALAGVPMHLAFTQAARLAYRQPVTDDGQCPGGVQNELRRPGPARDHIKVTADLAVGTLTSPDGIRGHILEHALGDQYTLVSIHRVGRVQFLDWGRRRRPLVSGCILRADDRASPCTSPMTWRYGRIEELVSSAGAWRTKRMTPFLLVADLRRGPQRVIVPANHNSSLRRRDLAIMAWEDDRYAKQ